MAKNFQTAEDIIHRLRNADARKLAVLEKTVAADTRKTVQAALTAARKRVAAEEAEAARLASMYTYQEKLSEGRVLVGLDEVGRGPLAGPLTVAAVVLPLEHRITGLNDSKQLSAAERECIAAEVKAHAVAWAIEHVLPSDIDTYGMTRCLKMGFTRVVQAIESAGVVPDVVLLDGNPLHFDAREVNVVKGDAKCASIAAASIIAKVARDEIMVELATQYPGYGFESNKGYGSAAHQEAIRELGISPVHRVSFCTAFAQATLF